MSDWKHVRFFLLLLKHLSEVKVLVLEVTNGEMGSGVSTEMSPNVNYQIKIGGKCYILYERSFCHDKRRNCNNQIRKRIVLKVLTAIFDQVHENKIEMESPLVSSNGENMQ